MRTRVYVGCVLMRLAACTEGGTMRNGLHDCSVLYCHVQCA